MIIFRTHRPRLLGVALVVGAGLACGSTLTAEADAEQGSRPAVTTPAERFSFEQQTNVIADVSERAVPSVVNVASVRKAPRPAESPFFSDPFFHRFFGPGFRFDGPGAPEQQAQGSGVIVREDGIVLTNNHVVQDAKKVKVTLSDRREYEAEVIGTDPPSDLAVLRLKDPPKGLRALKLGDSDVLRLGEFVIAIGNPFGVGQTVTLGIVSAKGRSNMGIVDYEDFIQTDAAINPGNSGGALVNLKGELVGINTAILSRSGGSQGVGFAIPANMARSVMTSLIENGKVVRGFLGVMIQDLTPELAEAMDLQLRDGVLVSDVTPDGPAAKAGLKPRDVIIALDGKKMTTSSKLRNVVAAAGAGKKIELTVLRDGDEKKLDVTLAEKPAEGLAAVTDQRTEQLGGLTVQPLTPELRRQQDLPERLSGVLVAAVEPGTPASRAGLMPGDVIVEANHQPVRTAADLRQAYQGRDRTLLRIHRGGGMLFLVLGK